MAENDWVLLLTAHTELDANLKKGCLEDAGIKCVIEPVAFRAYPSAGHFNLNVRQSQLAKAQEIINSLKA